MALVRDSVEHMRLHQKVKLGLDARANIAKEGHRRVRMLRRKLQKAVKELRNLRDYANSLDWQYGFEELAQRAEICRLELSKFLHVESLADEYAQRRKFGDNPRNDHIELRHFNPVTLYMVHLYWLFRDGCSLSGHESEVRVAMIRNSFWRELDVEPASYLDNYDGSQNKGCTTVRQAVARYR